MQSSQSQSKETGLEKIKDIYPLKHHQLSMIYNIMNKQDLYYERLVYLLKGNIYIERFYDTWEMIVQANDVLRSIYVWEIEKMPLQIVFENKKIPIHYFQSEEEYLLFYNKNDYKIDVSKNAIAVSLVYIEQCIYKMVIFTHHIVMDGWSHANLISQFVSAYLEGRNWLNKSQPDSYKQYMKYYLAKCKENQEYWLDYLNEFSAVEANGINTSSRTFHYISYELSLEYIERLSCILGGRKFTVTDIIYSFWGIMLFFFFEQKKTVFGFTLSGRDISGNSMKNILGMIISTVPVYIDFSRKMTFYSLTQEIKDIKLQHIKHQEYDLKEINKELVWLNRALYNSTVVVQNYPVLNTHQNEINVELIEHEYKNEMDVSLGIRIINNKAYFDYSYDSSLFCSRDIAFLHNCYVKLFQKIIEGYNVWDMEVDSIINLINDKNEIV